MSLFRPGALLSVAYKEFLHIARDWRIILLLVTFPPAFTLLMGHAFEESPLTDVPTILRDEDGSKESADLSDFLEKWTPESDQPPKEGETSRPAFGIKRDTSNGPIPDLLHAGVSGVVIIPKGWGKSLTDGEPIGLKAVLDGTDTTTASEMGGYLQQALGDFQVKTRTDVMIDPPLEIVELGKKIPEDFRHKLESLMEPWKVSIQNVYNPELKFIDYVTPGIVGLILQLLTVPLMAVTLTRERESGTLSQLLLTSLRHWEIVVGKVLPYLGLSTLMIGIVIAMCRWHFGVHFSEPVMLAFLCFLFLLCSLGLGLLISSFCNTQAQAIQFTVFFLLPIIPLCGAFAPLGQLPDTIRAIAEIFPLTHFCRAFRLANLSHAEFSFLAGDVAYLAIGALVTFVAAALLLRRAQN